MRLQPASLAGMSCPSSNKFVMGLNREGNTRGHTPFMGFVMTEQLEAEICAGAVAALRRRAARQAAIGGVGAVVTEAGISFIRTGARARSPA